MHIRADAVRKCNLNMNRLGVQIVYGRESICVKCAIAYYGRSKVIFCDTVVRKTIPYVLHWQHHNESYTLTKKEFAAA
jgi:hypothetical protein